MQVSKKIPFDDPQVLMGVRALYILSNLIIFAVYFYTGMQIKKKKDLTTLKYLEPAAAGSGEEPKLVTSKCMRLGVLWREADARIATIMEYDQQQLQAAYKQQLMGVGMMAFMHLYLKYTNPLIIQSIIPLKGVFEGNIAKVHIFGKPAVGELKRPWKAAGGFMGMGGGEIKTDKASLEAAERAGRGGAKEE